MDEDKKPIVSLRAALHDRVEWPGTRYTFKDEPLALASPNAPGKILTGSNLRNAQIEGAIRELEQLEKRFREGDPVREAVANARRAVAKHLTVSPTGGDGLRVVK